MGEGVESVTRGTGLMPRNQEDQRTNEDSLHQLGFFHNSMCLPKDGDGTYYEGTRQVKISLKRF